MSKKIVILCAEKDQTALDPILDALRAKGLRPTTADGAPRKTDTVLAVLSEAFYADSVKTELLLGLIGAGAENVLPLRLDSTPMPDTVKNALYARNIIPAEGRDAAHTADRVISALPKKKNRLPLMLILAGVALLAAVGLIIGLASRPKEEPPVTEPMVTPDPVVIPPGLGLTQEDLDAVRAVVIVGDEFRWATKDGWFGQTDSGLEVAGVNAFERWRDSELDFSYSYWDDDGQIHWVSQEDGHEYTLTHYDLSFLDKMPNLESLRITLADADIPNLSRLTKLDDFLLQDSPMEDIAFLSHTAVDIMHFLRVSVPDYSALNTVTGTTVLGIEQIAPADFSTLSPAASLNRLYINGVQDDRLEVDLSGLAGRNRLPELEIYNAVVSDLAFAQGMEMDHLLLQNLSGLTSLDGLENVTLDELMIRDCNDLRDISAVGTLSSLRELNMEWCSRVADYSPIQGCTALERVSLQCDNSERPQRDASFLRDLPKLTAVDLFGWDLADMNFLENMGDNGLTIDLGFAGNIEDYSGLAYIKNYGTLHVNPRRNPGAGFGDLSAVLPYLQGASVTTLHLHGCAVDDLSLLPKASQGLEIWGSSLRDLTGLPEMTARYVELRDCPYLESLDGLESLSALGNGKMELKIIGCPRLFDFSAIEHTGLPLLSLTGLYALPDFGGMHPDELRLESMDWITDLSALEALPNSLYSRIALVGLDAINDLSPLRGKKITALEVSPQVADQAQALVDEGTVRSFAVSYPDGDWRPEDNTVTLQSLEDLETLPKALLARVESLAIAGDTVIDRSLCDMWEDWEHGTSDGTPTLMLHCFETDESVPLAAGVITDLSVLAPLTGLRELELYGQPLETLDGIQALSSLKSFTARSCPALKDISALFALPELTAVDLKFTPADSIQGIQNLTELNRLDLSFTGITDLTPLADCDLSAPDGFDLWLEHLTPSEESIAALGSVKRYHSLGLWDTDPALWLPALKDSEIEGLTLDNSLFTNEDLAELAADHPELRELSLDRQDAVTDLTCLLPLENLERVRIDPAMEEAAASLDGTDCRFELER